MPENQLLVHFPLVRSGASSFCMMKKVGFKLVLIFHSLCRHVGEVAGYIPDPQSNEIKKSRVKEIMDESQLNRRLSTSESTFY
jgi:hypothetical protein